MCQRVPVDWGPDASKVVCEPGPRGVRGSITTGDLVCQSEPENQELVSQRESKLSLLK